ncbi:hypothetical protein [Microbispora sp. NBC_01389]
MRPPIEPYDHGHLDIGDGHLVYRNAGQCSGLQAGGEGPRGSAR